MALLDRVQRILWAPGRSQEERVNAAIETIADELDQVTDRLKVIDPEWELIARTTLVEIPPEHPPL